MPFHPLRQLLRYRVERFISGGILPRIIFIALLICGVVLIGGSLLWLLEGGDWHESLWWAFLRMSDPGYLGDDQGNAKRLLSTVVTIAGYVLFMGALIAIMTTWLHQMLRDAELGTTPITLRNHLVILGWSERTTAIIHDLLASDTRRMQRFLSLHGTSRLRIAILVKDGASTHEASLRQELGPLYKRRSIIFRHGEPDNAIDLARVNPIAASGIIFSGGYVNVQQLSTGHPDGSLLRSIMTIDQLMQRARHVPHLVSAYRDHMHGDALSGAYHKGSLLGICTPLFTGRLIAQSVVHPGLLAVIDALFDHQCPQGIHLGAIDSARFPSYGSYARSLRDGVALGIIRDAEVQLNPPADLALLAGDQSILIARSSAVCHSAPSPQQKTAPAPVHSFHRRKALRVVVLGCSRVLPYILEELADQPHDIECTCLSLPDPRFTRAHIVAEDTGLLPGRLELVEGDPLSRRQLTAVNAHHADAVVMLCDDRATSAEEADGRVLLIHQELQRIIDCPPGPSISIELRAPSSRQLTRHLSCDRLVSGEFISHAMAQVSLRPELLAVYDSLFASTGPGFALQPAQPLLGDTPVPADSARQILMQHNMTLIGYQSPAGMVINPDWQTARIPADPQLQLIVCMQTG